MSGINPIELENLPIELVVDIIKNLSSIDDISILYATSHYLQTLVKRYVQKLYNDKITYLGTDWMNNFPNLKDIDDNIIFELNVDNIKEIIIPQDLTKFNILLSSNKSIYDKSLIEIYKQVINNLITQVQDDLNIMTIRIHIQAEEVYKTFSFLIDKNTITIIFPDLGRDGIIDTETPYNIISSIHRNTNIYIDNDIPDIIKNQSYRYLKMKGSFDTKNLIYIDDPQLILSGCEPVMDKVLNRFIDTGIINKHDLIDTIGQYKCTYLFTDKELYNNIQKKNMNALYLTSHLYREYLDRIINRF